MFFAEPHPRYMTSQYPDISICIFKSNGPSIKSVMQIEKQQKQTENTDLVGILVREYFGLWIKTVLWLSFSFQPLEGGF